MSYNIFVSHAWAYTERYIGVVRLLDTASQNIPWFSYRDFSVPSHDPIVSPDERVKIAKLTALLRDQIKYASCIVVPAGMYVNHRYWIQTEINLALNGFSAPKPIIGIRRRNQQRTPVELENVATEMVNWNSNSLATAIYNVCG